MRTSARSLDRDPIRELHQGQRPDAPRKRAGHMTAPDQLAENVLNPLARGGRPHMNSFSEVSDTTLSSGLSAGVSATKGGTGAIRGTPEELAREFEPTAQSISTWVKQAERDAGKRADGPTSAEREELGRLRRENHRLRQERDILAKAAAWFARESKASPNGFTGS